MNMPDQHQHQISLRLMNLVVTFNPFLHLFQCFNPLVIPTRIEGAPQKRAEISPAAEVATSKPVSGPVGFVDSAIEVVDLEPICSSVAPLPGKLSWINSIGSGMWPFH